VKKLLVLLLLVGGIAAFLYYPREAAASAADAATLAILNTAIDGSRSGGGFAPALDGEIFKTGDLVRANVDGRAVLTFFDASTLSVDPGSQVKVLALNRVAGDGIQVTIEQTLGRSWSSVQKLKTPDSRYELKTPSATAAVRGTAFLTLVQPLPAGGTQTTYQVDEGTLQVTAVAGGTVTVPAGTQVTIAEGAPAPAAPTPIPPSPRLEFTGSAGLGFLVVSPNGAWCGPSGNTAEVFGCVVTGSKIRVRDPAAGRWGIFMTSGPALPGASITVESFTGSTRNALRALSRSLNAGDQLRGGITLTAGPPLALSQFEELSLVTSACAATAPGRIFAAGPLEARIEAARAFAGESKGTPVSLVYTEAELNQLVAAAPAAQGVTLTDAKIRIDRSGIHGTASAATQFITLNANADVVGGPVGDKFTLRVSRLSADPLPPGLVDAIRGLAEASTADVSSAIPFLVRQVSFRPGCFFVSGVTPA
jgi:hypothetical protein